MNRTCFLYALVPELVLICLGDYIQRLKQALERDALRARFERYPLLQLLLCEFWFRVVFVALILGGLALALCLPKIWQTSPSGFLPIIKISVVDMVQAWSLKRTALKAEADNNNELALFSWQGAVGNNTANPVNIRHLMRYLVKTDDHLTHAGMAISQTTWLMRLTSTNKVDLELAAVVFNKYRMPTLSLMLLEPRANELTDAMNRSYLEALFDSGQVENFAKRWEKSSQEIKQNPELKLYYAAYLAGWQSGSLASQGRLSLAEAMANPVLENLALRLTLNIHAKFGDLSGYQAILARLQKNKADMVLEHIAQWKLLVANGRKAEAVSLAKNFTNAPLTAIEAQELSIAYSNLDQPEKARQTLNDSMDQFIYAPALWESMAEMMVRGRQWLELQALALRMRDERAVRDVLSGYSHYLEGRAQLGQNRPNEAMDNFKIAVASKYDNLQLALQVADNLIKLGYAGLLKDFLPKLEPKLDKEPVYWQIVFNASFELKDDKLLLRAATRSFEMNPQNAMVMNNYAAALLVLRQKPDEAVKITKRLLTDFPGATPVLINHCFALLLNQRTQEAETAMKTIRQAMLKPQEVNDYHLAWFEIYVQNKQWESARKSAKNIDTKGFFPDSARLV